MANSKERERLLGSGSGGLSDSDDDLADVPPIGPSGGGSGSGRGGSGPYKDDDKVSKVKGQIAEVVNVMQTNIDKVIQRGERLEELEDRTADLADSSMRFKNRSRQLRRIMWWKNIKMQVMIACVVIIILAIIIGVLVSTFKS